MTLRKIPRSHSVRKSKHASQCQQETQTWRCCLATAHLAPHVPKPSWKNLTTSTKAYQLIRYKITQRNTLEINMARIAKTMQEYHKCLTVQDRTTLVLHQKCKKLSKGKIKDNYIVSIVKSCKTINTLTDLQAKLNSVCEVCSKALPRALTWSTSTII